MPFRPLKKTGSFAPDDVIDRASDFSHFFVAGGKPQSEWAVGAEVELFGYTRDTLQRITPRQINAIVEAFEPTLLGCIKENGSITEATLAGSQGEPAGRLTLEPGGQLEFSAAYRRSLDELDRDLRALLRQLAANCEANNIVLVSSGFDPLRTIDEQSWIDKRRYEIMRPYLKTRGERAWDMMCRTAAVQVNLDYSDLQDLSRKFTLANRLAPVAAAIFANSPFQEGRLSGYKTTRAAAWLETDLDRTGAFPLALDDGFSVERFVEQLSRVPMFFVRRDGKYIDYTGHSFGEFLGRCGCPETPIFQDFTDHLTTVFTEARLKPHIEQRSMDSGSAEMVMAALAFWKGLMYDSEALDGALRLVPKMNLDEFLELQRDVARRGLEARSKKASVLKLAEASIELARSGLRRIAPAEASYLNVIEQLVMREHVCPADILIRNFNGSWNGDIRKAFEYSQIG